MNILNHFITLVAVCLFVFQPASAQKATATSAREIKADLMIKNINVIDVKTGKVKLKGIMEARRYSQQEYADAINKYGNYIFDKPDVHNSLCLVPYPDFYYLI